MNQPTDPSVDDAATVHPAALPTEKLLEHCTVRRGRASGPGGQHRNKVETAIELVHEPTGVTAVAYERRSQEQNRKTAIRRLRMNLAVEVRNVATDFVEPSGLWESRLRGGRIQCSDQHADFPSMLAEAMDAVHAKSYDVKRAAAALGCSSSQLVRFVAKLPEALQRLNAEREALGLRKLRR